MKNYMLIYFWLKLTICTIQNSRFDDNPRSSKDINPLENNSGNKTQRKGFTDFSINKILGKSTPTEEQNSFSELNESSGSSDRLASDEDYDSNQSNQDIPVSNHNELDTSTFSNDQNQTQNQDKVIEYNEYPLDLSTHSKRSMENTVSIPDLSRTRKNSSDSEIDDNPKKFRHSKDDQDQGEIIIDDGNPLDLSIHSRRSDNMENLDSLLDLSNKNPRNSKAANPKKFGYFENVQESSLLNPNDVSSVDLYKYFLELVARFFYLQKELGKFGECFILSVTENKESKRIESFEEFLVTLVGKLLIFNESNITPVDFKAEREIIYNLQKMAARLTREKWNLLEASNKISNDPIEKSKISKKIDKKQLKIDFYLKKIEEEREKNNFDSISEQIKLLKFAWRTFNIYAQTLCAIFGPINKIMKYYNDNLRSIFHQYLIKLDLSFIPQNRKFIDYTKYENYPHCFAYFLVDLFFSLLSKNKDNCYGLYSSKINSLELLPYLNIIFFLSFNKPDTIQAILSDSFCFSGFINYMKFAFSPEYDSKYIKELYKNFEDIKTRCYNNKKETSLITLESYSEIAKIENDLNINLKLFYSITYVIFTKLTK